VRAIPGWRNKQQLIWVKNSLVLGRSDYQWQHEPCIYGTKEGAAHYFIDARTETTVIEDRINVNKLGKDELKELCKSLMEQRVETTILREDKPSKNDIHPTMKPVKLFARLIMNSTKKKEKVLDIFGGSGTTIMACEQLGRTAYAMELDPRYCDAIVQRYEELTGQKAELVGRKE
jgi:site-specific DNA-methyltransferase (adenine-specific)